MAIGDRIKFFRKLRGLTQKELGVMAGLNDKTADIRISQYESGLRTPKEDLLNRLAYSRRSARSLECDEYRKLYGRYADTFRA